MLPAAGTETARSEAIWGSRPTTANSVSPIAKVPIAMVRIARGTSDASLASLEPTVHGAARVMCGHASTPCSYAASTTRPPTDKGEDATDERPCPVPRLRRRRGGAAGGRRRHRGGGPVGGTGLLVRRVRPPAGGHAYAVGRR